MFVNDFEMKKFKINEFHYTESNSKENQLSLKVEIDVQTNIPEKSKDRGIIRISVLIFNGKDTSDSLNLSLKSLSLFQFKENNDNFEESLKNECFRVAYEENSKRVTEITAQIGLQPSIELPLFSDLGN